MLPPGAFTSTPPDVLLGQPGFGGLEGEDPLQSASLPQDEFLVSSFKHDPKQSLLDFLSLKEKLAIFQWFGSQI